MTQLMSTIYIHSGIPLLPTIMDKERESSLDHHVFKSCSSNLSINEKTIIEILLKSRTLPFNV